MLFRLGMTRARRMGLNHIRWSLIRLYANVRRKAGGLRGLNIQLVFGSQRSELNPRLLEAHVVGDAFHAASGARQLDSPVNSGLRTHKAVDMV